MGPVSNPGGTSRGFLSQSYQLSNIFRVPTPEWDSVQWAWDKRNTYKLARELGIPTPATCYPETIDQLAELEGFVAAFCDQAIDKRELCLCHKGKGVARK